VHHWSFNEDALSESFSRWISNPFFRCSCSQNWVSSCFTSVVPIAVGSYTAAATRSQAKELHPGAALCNAKLVGLQKTAGR